MKAFLIFVLLFYHTIVIADWTQTNGIKGGAVSKLFATGNKLFAAVNRSTGYLSYNGGQSYIIRSTGIKGVGITSFASKDNIVFAGSDSGIYKTTNDGLNWIKSNSELNTNYISSLVVNGNILAAGTSPVFTYPLMKVRAGIIQTL